jgi:hypothetical protein
VRVTVQLVGVGNGAPLWAAPFDEPFTDIFSIEDTISKRVAEALTQELLVKENTWRTASYARHGAPAQAHLKAWL